MKRREAYEIDRESGLALPSYLQRHRRGERLVSKAKRNPEVANIGPALFIASGNHDPFWSSVLLLSPGQDFVDYGPLSKGTATTTSGASISSSNQLVSLNTIAFAGTSGQEAQWASSSLSPPWCLEFYARFAAANVSGGLFGSRSSANKGILISGTGGANAVTFACSNASGSSVATSNYAAYTTNTWQHYALQIDASGNAGSFLGGVSTGAVTANWTGPITQGTHWCLGNWSSDVGNIGPVTCQMAWCRVTAANRYPGTTTFTPPVPPYPTS